jgi:two-component sensor histidine kinase
MNYAKAQGKITDAVSYKEWCDDYFEMEGALQKQWEQEFSALLNQSASLAERLQWLEHYFFKLDIIGFEIESIQFKEYETTESFLFILMNEILVNAFKYYASENKQPVVLEWTATENDQILSCRNPSIRRERDQHKGSGKGHTFLSALARKTGCKFTKPKPQDDFLLEFAIPNQLLLSNVGAEK